MVQRALSSDPAIKSGNAKVNPGAAWFWGWRLQDGQGFEYTDEGLARAYLASLWAARCIYLRAQKVSSIPLIVKTIDDKYPGRDGKAYDEPLPSRVHQHVLQRLLDRQFKPVRRKLEYDFCIWGRAFIEPGQGGLRRLNPTTIEIDKDPEDGITGYHQNIAGAPGADYKPSDLVYIYDFDPEDDLGGVPLLAWALQVVGAENATRDYVANFFENDATPAGMITSDQLWQQTDIERAQNWWDKLFKGAQNKGKIAVMPGGLKFEQISPNIDNMAISELRLEIRREICAIFGVPMTIAGADEAANYSTAQQQYSAFYTETIIPQVEMMVDALNEQLVPRFGSNLKIVAELSDIEVLQEDRAELTTRLSTAVGGGFMTLNEARRIEGNSPFDEDYVLLPSVGLVKVDDLPKIAAKALVDPNAQPGYPPSDQGNEPTEPPAPELPPTNPPPEPPEPENPDGGKTGMPGEGYIVPIQRHHGPLPPSSYLHPRASKAMPTEPIAQDTPQSVKAVGGEAYIGIPLANNTDVLAVQDVLRMQLGTGDDIEYQTAETFHVTLVYAPQVDDMTLRKIANAMGPMSTELRAIGISSFDTPDGEAIHIALAKTPTLKACQAAVFKAFLDAGVMMSEYSIPEQWQPHITLAYAKPGSSDAIDPSDIEPFTAWVTEVDVSRPDYRVIRVITPSGLPSVDADVKRQVALDDLKRWQRKASTKGIHKPFSSVAIPESIQTFVRWDLEFADTPDAIKAVFDKAAAQINSADATPAEFDAFWGGLGDVSKDLMGQVEQMLTAPELRQRLAEQIRGAGNVDIVPAFFEQLNREWADKLVGTEEEPGPLAKIYLAGAARGNELHQQALPKKHRARKALVGVGWNLLAKDALENAKTQTFDLVRGINQQTADAFREGMTDWLNRGGSLVGLVDLLHGRLRGLDLPAGWSPAKIDWATSKARARLIAQTESTRTFTEGNIARWKQVGVTEHRWRTQNDTDVCPVCKSLNNQIAAIGGSGFVIAPNHRQQYGQYIKRPPLHPGCRCFPSPITAYSAAKPTAPKLVVEG